MSAPSTEPPEPVPSEGLSVIVAVLTYRRPDDLEAVLPMLVEQVRGLDGRAAEILVVDNDPDGAAAPCVAGFPGVRYVHEPRPGIAAGRNRALDEATGHDLLVFIDDDERPCERWLAHLVETFDAAPCSGVVGPVVSSFAVPPAPWVEAGGFFTRRRMPTGSTVTVAATNNLLLDLRVVRSAGLCFDERLGLAGGSDTLFTRQLVAAAGPLRWCDEAVVTDVVPAARTTARWVLQRQLRSGNSWSRTAMMLAVSPHDRLLTRVRLTGKGGVRLVGGPARWLLGALTRNLRHRAAGAKTTARGLGILMGAYGATYAEYRRPTPSGRGATAHQ